MRWARDPVNRAEAVALYVEQLKLPEDVATQCYEIAANAESGLAKDAALDREGFRSILNLRTATEGGSPLSPETYLDLSYYQQALTGM